jgi:hypothetical protein
MKSALAFVGLFLLAAASAQQNNEPHPKGVIYGIAIGQDGQPAKRIGLTAGPLGVALGAVLPPDRNVPPNLATLLLADRQRQHGIDTRRGPACEREFHGWVPRHRPEESVPWRWVPP